MHSKSRKADGEGGEIYIEVNFEANERSGGKKCNENMKRDGDRNSDISSAITRSAVEHIQGCPAMLVLN